MNHTPQPGGRARPMKTLATIRGNMRREVHVRADGGDLIADRGVRTLDVAYGRGLQGATGAAIRIGLPSFGVNNFKGYASPLAVPIGGPIGSARPIPPLRTGLPSTSPGGVTSLPLDVIRRAGTVSMRG